MKKNHPLQPIDSVLDSEISSICKLVAIALYSHQNRETGLCYPSVRTLAEECSSSPTTIQKALKELKDRGFIEWEQKRIKFRREKSNHYKLLFVELEETDTAAVTTTDTTTVTTADTTTVTTIVTPVTGTEPLEPLKPKEPKKPSGFRPPSLEDVKTYCEERKNNVDPQTFLDHYQANGWMRGKTKIKDWQACVRTWEKNQKSDSPNAGKKGYSKTGKTPVWF